MGNIKNKNDVRFPDIFNLADYYLFDRLKEGFGDKTAIRYGDLSYTYKDVADKTRCLANYFESIGVGREERIYTVLPDVPPFAWSFFCYIGSWRCSGNGQPRSADIRFGIRL